MFYWSGVAIWAAVIFILSSFSHPLPVFAGKIFPDWVLHGVEYGILGFFLGGTLRSSFRIRDAGILVLSVVFLGACYGFSDEWHQSFVPCRRMDIKDFTVDVFGVFCGALVLLAAAGFFKRKKKVYASN
jgi:VanZ family protein